MIRNPALLPKVRSRALLDAVQHMPCTLRLASFAGMSCAGQDTVVPCHLATIGKGTSTKVSDLFVAAGCCACHDLLDGRNTVGLAISLQHPAAWGRRILDAMAETQSRWVEMGVLHDDRWEVIG